MLLFAMWECNYCAWLDCSMLHCSIRCVKAWQTQYAHAVTSTVQCFNFSVLQFVRRLCRTSVAPSAVCVIFSLEACLYSDLIQTLHKTQLCYEMWWTRSNVFANGCGRRKVDNAKRQSNTSKTCIGYRCVAKTTQPENTKSLRIKKKARKV